MYLHGLLKCPYCESVMEVWVQLDAERQTGQFVTAYCPADASPHRVGLEYLKPAEQPPPGARFLKVQSRTAQPQPELEQSRKRWWQFWR